MKRILAAIIATFLLAASTFAQALFADLAVTNANVQTIDTKRPTARAFAVRDGRIVAVGSDADIKPLIGPVTRVIDAQGRLVIPGFNDSHVHFLETGMQLSLVDLRTARSPEEFVARIKAFADKLPKGRWILGGKWDHENWTPNNLPTAKLIDAVTPDHPVFIDRLDGHMALANTAAMKLAGIDKSVKDVAGGEIVRDSDGNPTGVLKDAAMGYVGRVIPDAPFDAKVAAVEAATRYVASLGITSVQDVSAGTDIAVYQEVLRQGKLNTRIYGCSPLGDYKRWQNTGVQHAFGEPMLRVGCLKGFADGSLGATTAWFFEPYKDAPNSTGLASDEYPDLVKNTTAADKAGLQVVIHAIGDKANASVFDVFAEAAKANGERDRRFRIEHAQHLRQQDIPRFASQHVIASMQPYHAIDDGRWAWKRIDEKRIAGTYAFRTLLDKGAVIAFGSDSPVAPIDPILGVYAAVTRRTLDDKNPNGWVPEQKISVLEAVRAFTMGSAYAEYQEDIKGSITPGKVADFLILSQDIFTMDPTKIRDARVALTAVNGKVVYEAK